MIDDPIRPSPTMHAFLSRSSPRLFRMRCFSVTTSYPLLVLPTSPIKLMSFLIVCDGTPVFSSSSAEETLCTPSFSRQERSWQMEQSLIIAG